MAANRIPEKSGDLPVRTFVITREEIARNGFTTLVDVLKTLPGFHTSQPGSSELGETFLQRGLVGNIYTKIMINSVPISPSAAPGMPLGAQLPVKQAERIEIILGPATNLYGNDAMAGVINIVLPEVDRPVTAMGNVAAGLNGLSEVHLSLGGMLGKRKNVIRYNFFGSTRRINHVEMYVPWGDTLYAMNVDSLDSLDRMVPREDSLYPDIEDFQHDSRMIGVTIDYKGLKFSAMGMSRLDHSALGSHPDNVAYYNASTTTSEDMFSYSAQFRKEIILQKRKNKQMPSDAAMYLDPEKKKAEKKLFMFTNASLLQYEIDESSSIEALLHPIVFDKNFIYAQSTDILVEQLFNLSIAKKLNIMAGGSYSRKTGTPYFNYYGRPYEEGDTVKNPENPDQWGYSTSGDEGGPSMGSLEDGSSLLAPWVPQEGYSATDWGVFSQIYLRTKYLNVVGGFRLDFTGALTDTRGVVELSDEPYLIPSPKLGVTFKPHEKFRIRGVYSEAFRRPGTYYFYNNYSQAPRETGSPDFVPLVRSPASLELESLANIEGGFTWDILESLRLEGHYYFTRRFNSMFPVIGYRARSEDQDTLGQEASETIGFTNHESLSILHGIQGFLYYDKGPLRFDIGGQMNFGDEFIDEVDTLNGGYRLVPVWMIKANVHIDMNKAGTITLNGRLVGPYVGGLIEENDEVFRKDVPGFYSADLVYSVTFINKLQAYVKVTNFTNSKLFTRKKYYDQDADTYDLGRFNNVAKGIFTSSLTGNELNYIPQLRTMVTVGLTYTLN